MEVRRRDETATERIGGWAKRVKDGTLDPPYLGNVEEEEPKNEEVFGKECRRKGWGRGGRPAGGGTGQGSQCCRQRPLLAWASTCSISLNVKVVRNTKTWTAHLKSTELETLGVGPCNPYFHKTL